MAPKPTMVVVTETETGDVVVTWITTAELDRDLSCTAALAGESDDA